MPFKRLSPLRGKGHVLTLREGTVKQEIQQCSNYTRQVPNQGIQDENIDLQARLTAAVQNITELQEYQKQVASLQVLT